MNFKFELLQELCTICRDNGIECYLYGTLLQSAYTEETVDPKWNSYDIVMTGEGYRALCGIVSSKEFKKDHPNRVLEDLSTNPFFPGFFANYVATDTLHIDFRDDPKWFQNKGMSIHILLLTNNVPDNISGKVVMFLRKAYLYTVSGSVSSFGDAVRSRLYQIIFSVCGRSLKNKLFDNYLNNWRSESKISSLYLADGRQQRFQKHFWESPEEKKLDGVIFTVPRQCSLLKLRRCYYSLDVIYSENMSYDDFRRLCSENDIDVREAYEQRKNNREAILDDMHTGRKNRRFYNAAFYCTLIRHNVSVSVERCEDRSLESPEYREVIEAYLEDLIAQYKNGITPYVSYSVYLDAMKAFIQQNLDVYHLSKGKVRRMLLKYMDRIPNHYFLQSPIIAASCYSAEEIGKGVEQIREELREAIILMVNESEPLPEQEPLQIVEANSPNGHEEGLS